jgi:hypothetical protein
MSSLRLHVLVTIATLALAACGSAQRPQLKVLGVDHSERSIHLFVEVTNYAKRPMRLQRLDYAFGPSGAADEAHGQVTLSRTIEAGSAVVVEVPIDVAPGAFGDAHLELRGNLIAEQDSVLRAYPVAAPVDDHQSANAQVP